MSIKTLFWPIRQWTIPVICLYLDPGQKRKHFWNTYDKHSGDWRNENSRFCPLWQFIVSKLNIDQIDQRRVRRILHLSESIEKWIQALTGMHLEADPVVDFLKFSRYRYNVNKSLGKTSNKPIIVILPPLTVRTVFVFVNIFRNVNVISDFSFAKISYK